MTCKQAESLIMPYIQSGLPDEMLAPFLEHLEHCQNCQDELEIYYIVAVGLSQLDLENGIYDIKGNLEDVIEASRQELSYKKIRKIFLYIVNTLFVYAVIIVLILQLRIWWQYGI